MHFGAYEVVALLAFVQSIIPVLNSSSVGIGDRTSCSLEHFLSNTHTSYLGSHDASENLTISNKPLLAQRNAVVANRSRDLLLVSPAKLVAQCIDSETGQT
jgi:hypothetical protein